MIADSPMNVDVGNYPAETPWDSATSRAEMFDWVDGQLTRLGQESFGPLDVRVRPWSIVIRIPTPAGPPLWFKANPPGSAFEPALSSALGDWLPGSVLTPLAVDTERGWSLLPDGGPLLTHPEPDDPPGAFRLEPVRQFALLQRSLVARVDDLLALGVPDLRAEVIPDALDSILDRAPTPEVSAARGRILAWASELAATGHAATLDHGDLHDRQIFVAQNGRYRFFDWGDASIGHPFAALRVTLDITVENYGAQSPAVARLVDAFLSPWEGDPVELRHAARLAHRLAPLGRALSWTRIFPGTGRFDPADYIRVGLRHLLDDPPL